MYQIRSDFEGANIKVLSSEETTAKVDVDLRDTTQSWFFWCFRVVGDGGRTLTFEFPSRNRVGYFGAAVSHDYRIWCWQYPDGDHSGSSFTYTFAENETDVYFAHDILYRPARFLNLQMRADWRSNAFAKAKKAERSPILRSVRVRS